MSLTMSLKVLMITRY